MKMKNRLYECESHVMERFYLFGNYERMYSSWEWTIVNIHAKAGVRNKTKNKVTENVVIIMNGFSS